MAKKRNKDLVIECLKRDGHRCVKCGRTDSLQAHHIVALVDGGADELDNLATLCALCHAEWHSIDLMPRMFITFEHWLTFPPWRIILYGLMNSPDNLRVGEFIRIMAATIYDIHNSATTDDAENSAASGLVTENGHPRLLPYE